MAAGTSTTGRGSLRVYDRKRSPLGPPLNEEKSVSDYLLKFFKSDHLPQELADVSEWVEVLAVKMNEDLPNNPEKTVGLRKLLEAKDCFVRSKIAGDMTRPVLDKPA